MDRREDRTKDTLDLRVKLRAKNLGGGEVKEDEANQDHFHRLAILRNKASKLIHLFYTLENIFFLEKLIQFNI